MTAKKLVLASRSPRRQELLRQIGVPFVLAPQQVDESPVCGETAEQLVTRLAQAKARSALDHADEPQAVVLGADTVVVHEDQVMGQPADREAALAMLLRLSAATHRVCTAVSVIDQSHSDSRLSVTEVRFRPISVQEAEHYWQTGEPLGKAGAYAIQGLGAVFVESIRGSYSGVVGLPLFETASLLQACGIPCWQAPGELNNE